ncbi:MAG: Smr/MutS family protein, partial [Bacteroidota bacterium]
KEEKLVAEVKEKEIKPLGIALMELSLLVLPGEGKEYHFWLMNPEPADLLYTCFLKSKSSYQGVARGLVRSGEREKLFSSHENDLLRIKALHFQWLGFQAGKGHPHQPAGRELVWAKNQLRKPTQYVRAVNEDAWLFSLRVDQQALDIQKIEESEFVRIRKEDKPQPRLESEVDLHIEAIVKNVHELAPSEMLKKQLDFLKQSLSDALVRNDASLVLIHGVGQGILKKEVEEILKHMPQVKSYGPADLRKYGNGATKVVFR